jgi:outer membrane receptor protein involved in Fe transport
MKQQGLYRFSVLVMMFGIITGMCSDFTLSTGLHAQTGFTIQGRVVDKVSGKPLAGAHAELKSLSQNVAYMAASGEDGTFRFEDVTEGWYKLKITHVGYKTFKKDSLYLNDKKTLPDCRMKPDSSLLKPVTVEEAAPAVTLEADRKIYRAEAFPSATGGSALDVLRNLPGIQVEPNGRISLRGSRGVLIYIDGRQSSLSGSGRRMLLQSIPADQIERIEVITQPGAAYDAEGTSGIINIVLKQSDEKNTIWGGTLMAGTHNKYNAGLFVQHSDGRWNLSGYYNFRYTALWSRGTLERIFQPDDSARQFQKRHWLENGAQHNGRFRLRYQASQTLSLFIESNVRFAHKVESRYFLYEQSAPAMGSRFSDRLNSEAQNDRNSEGASGFEWKTINKKHLIKGELSYSDKFTREFDRFHTQQLNENLVVVSSQPELRRQTLNERWRIAQARLDYDWKPAQNWHWESGVKLTHRYLDNDFRVEDLNYDSSRWLVNPSLTNRYSYKEWVPAAYASVRLKKQRWSIKAGLRMEGTFITIRELTQNISARNHYLQLFPSASVAWKAGEKTSLRLSYARRVNRPSPGWLNPFPDISDPLTVRFGNPYLNPETSETGELSLEYKGSRFTMAPSVYGRYIRGVMGRFVTVGSDGTAIQTYRNLRNAWAGGIEWVSRYQPASWFQLLSSINLFYYAVSGENLQSDLNNSAVGGFIKLTPEWRWRFLTLFLSAQYILPQATVQTRYRARYFLDAALRADFLDRRLSLTFSCSDVFNSYYNYYITRNAGFTQYVMRKNETLIVQLSVQFRLSKARKKLDSEDETRPEWENIYDD